jgi:sugar phosphate isomerase/epimerase
MVRFGGPAFLGASVIAGPKARQDEKVDPGLILEQIKKKGYRAAYAPNVRVDQTEEIREIRQLFEKADIMIGEVGYWENLLDTDLQQRQRNRSGFAEALALADALGARCAVNILGSYGSGVGNRNISARNFADESFDQAVEIARYCIDGVRPTTAFFAYEIYPFSVVDSPEMIAKLLKAVDRKQFGVHMDLPNLLNCPRNYFDSAGVIQRSAKLFGDRIVAAHVKDLKLHEPAISVVLQEVRPGLGGVDLAAYMRAMHQLPQEVPFLMEHLPNEAEYDLAAAHLRSVAAAENIDL